MGAQNGKVMMGGDFLSQTGTRGGDPTHQDRQHHNSLLVCFLCVSVFLFSFKFYQEVLQRWSGFGGDHSASHLELLTTNVDFVASTRHVPESERLETCQVRTWTHLFLETNVTSVLFVFLMDVAFCAIHYKRHCEKKGLMTSSNQTYLIYEAV